MKLFKLNEKVELCSKNDEKISGRIYDIEGEKLYISISADDGGFKLLSKGEEIMGFVYCVEDILRFDATITGRIFTNTSVYEISNIKNFVRIQRRENIRVKSSTNMKYTDSETLLKIDFTGKEELGFKKAEKHLREGFLIDLSAGGIKLSTVENFNIGNKLLLFIDLEGKKMILKGKIVHKEFNFIPRKPVYFYGIQFIDIKTNQQEKIISYLFVKMRKNRMR